MKYYIQRHIHLDEFNALLSSISTLSTSSDAITQELLDFLLALLDPPSSSTDTTIGLLCEPNMIENLYALLTISQLSSVTKETVLKIVKSLVASRRVPQQVRAQLRLETNHIGFGGIISGLDANELNVSMVRDILNLIINSDSTVAVDHLNVVLTLCSAASLDVRYVAMRKLMTCFIAHPTACRSYAKCVGWQETLAHFFIKSRRSSSMKSFRASTSSNMSIEIKDYSADSGRGSTNGPLIEQSSSQSVLAPPRILETSSSPDDPQQQRRVRQLDLSPITNETLNSGLNRTFLSSRESFASNSALSPTSPAYDSKDTTPEFLRRLSGGFQPDTITTPPRSSSGSREDLLSLMKTDVSNEDLVSTASSNDALSPPLPSMMTTSIKDLCDDEEHNEHHRSLAPEIRQILGRRFAPLHA